MPPFKLHRIHSSLHTRAHALFRRRGLLRALRRQQQLANRSNSPTADAPAMSVPNARHPYADYQSTQDGSIDAPVTHIATHRDADQIIDSPPGSDQGDNVQPPEPLPRMRVFRHPKAAADLRARSAAPVHTPQQDISAPTYAPQQYTAPPGNSLSYNQQSQYTVPGPHTAHSALGKISATFPDLFAWFGSVICALPVIVGAVVRLGILALFVMAVLYFKQKKTEQSPYSNLQSFALSEIVSNDLAEVGDLTVDGLKLYAQATCVQGQSADEVRSALRMQLRDIPQDAREDIIASAVIDKASITSSRQDTTAETSESGKAFSYLAFWSTAYNGEQALLAAKYSTCVMAAGVDIKIGEDLAGFETSTFRKQIGNKPCECGLLRCATCPEYENVVTRKPVFKRHKLTLKNQLELHRWMVKQAVDRANSLVQTRESLVEKLMDTKDTNGGLKSLKWHKPNTNQFLGDDTEIAVDGSGEAPQWKNDEL